MAASHKLQEMLTHLNIKLIFSFPFLGKEN